MTDYETGVRDGIDYARGFLVGAGEAADVLHGMAAAIGQTGQVDVTMHTVADMFRDAARELGTVTPEQVRARKAGR